MRSIKHKHKAFDNLAITLDGKFLIGALDYVNIGIMDIISGKIVHILEGHQDCIRCICLTPDGKTIISGSDDCSTRIWDLNSRRQIFKLNDGAGNICITSDGRLLIRSQLCHIDITNLKTLSKIMSIEASDSFIRSLKVTLDNNFIINSAGSSIKFWNSKTFLLERSITL